MRKPTTIKDCPKRILKVLWKKEIKKGDQERKSITGKRAEIMM